MIAVATKDGVIAVKASGTFDLAAAELITCHVDPENPPKDIRICMNEVEYIAASALGELLTTAYGFCPVHIRGNENVREIIELIRAAKWLPNFTHEMEKEFASVEQQLVAA